MESKTEDTIDSIYDYTNTVFERCEESLNRLDQKSSTFIGFSGILIRLILDLPENHEFMKGAVCLFSISAIILSTVGLFAKWTGKAPDPRLIIKENLDDDEFEHQMVIIDIKMKLVDEYKQIIKNKQRRTNLSIFCFCLAIICYGLIVSNLDTQIWIIIQNKLEETDFTKELESIEILLNKCVEKLPIF
jgi:hypothetical protein